MAYKQEPFEEKEKEHPSLILKIGQVAETCLLKTEWYLVLIKTL